MKDKKNIKGLIITVIVVGLLSLIPYFINKDNPKEKIVKKDDNFKIGKLEYKIPYVGRAALSPPLIWQKEGVAAA